MERISESDFINKVIDKIARIRISGINSENKKESFALFKCVFSYYSIKFPDDKIIINLNKLDKNMLRSFFRIIDELIIYGYYFGLIEYTFSIIDKLLLLPENNHKELYNFNQMLSNKKFYIPQLKVKKRWELKIECENNYVPMNASLLKINDGYLVYCRTVNYRLYENGRWEIVPLQDKQRSIPMMIELDKEFNVKSQKKIINNSIHVKYNGYIEGLEDGILFQYNNDIYMSCTTLDVSPKQIPQM